MGNNPNEVTMIFDLNQEPLDQAQNFMHNLELESLSNEVESPRDRIEPENVSLNRVVDRVSAQETAVSCKKCSEKSPTYLVSRALESEPFHSDDPCYNAGSGKFYDCNVCLRMAMEPVLTCCGHLFCWPCFYNLRYEHSNVKECPVCLGDVVDTSLVPIYGNGDFNPNPNPNPKRKKISGLDVPPRPKAKRVENVDNFETMTHQRRVIPGWFTSRVEERIQQLANIVSRIESRDPTTEPPQNVDAHDSSRLVSERSPGSSSFMYVSYALNPPEMIVENELVFDSVHDHSGIPIEEIGTSDVDLLTPVSPRWLELGMGFEAPTPPPHSPQHRSSHND